MPVAAPTGNPDSSNLDIEEMVEYPVPETHYQSPVLQQLAWSVHEFIEEGGELDPMIEAYEAFREIFEGFKQEIPKIKEICYSQQGVLEDDPMPSQIKYMISNAEKLYFEGEAIFENYLDSLEDMGEDEEFPDPEPLVEGTKKWLQCNDSVCITFDYIVGRTRGLEEYLEAVNIALAEKIEAEKQQGQAPDAPPAIPADSTDLA
jgi:hypothetical protein